MSKVLVVIPTDRFRDEEYRVVHEALNYSHTVELGASHLVEVQGMSGLKLMPEIDLNYVEPSDYDALVFIGGQGVESYLHNPQVARLIVRFHQERKILAAIGTAVQVLLYSGLLAGKRMTAASSLLGLVQDSGAYFSGRGTEWDGNILTAIDYRVAEEFATELNKALSH